MADKIFKTDPLTYTSMSQRQHAVEWLKEYMGNGVMDAQDPVDKSLLGTFYREARLYDEDMMAVVEGRMSFSELEARYGDAAYDIAEGGDV